MFENDSGNSGSEILITGTHSSIVMASLELPSGKI